MPSLTHRRHAPPRRRLKPVFCILKFTIMAVITLIFLFFLGFAAIILLHFFLMSNITKPRPRVHCLSRPMLPGLVYKIKDLSKVTDCAICLEGFEEGDLCCEVPACGHLFHGSCLDKWIGKNPSCPVCRSRIDLGVSMDCSAGELKRVFTGVDEGSSSYWSV